MAPKFLWILLPLLLYAAYLAVALLRGRMPLRRAVNIHTSILLMVYLLGTAGLGLFWVANQQLPVFDWHYLFGYATLLLVAMHLTFNLPIVAAWLRRPRTQQPAAFPASTRARRAPWRAVLLAAVAGLALSAAYLAGTRHGTLAPSRASAATDSAAAVQRYHELSSASRRGVLLRAPDLAWGGPPPPFKTYPEHRHIPLPEQPPLHAAAHHPLASALRRPAPPRGLDAAILGQLLFLAAGVTQRGDPAKRAAPSSGALFASELYVAVRSVAGIAPGLYHYDANRHRLAVLGALPAALGAPQAVDAAALVITSAIFRRTAFKYHQRAYRYVAADLGHLLENLRLAAHLAGQRIDLLPQFDEMQAARALGIDGVEEGVMAMAALHTASASPPAAPASAAPAEVYPASPFGAALQVPDHPLGPTGEIHQAASLTLGMPDTHASIALPTATLPAVDTHATIVQRRSIRRYGDTAVPLAALSAMLAAVAQPPLLSDALRINLVVNRVQGLAPGIYRYAPDHTLYKVADGAMATQAQRAALDQQVIGDAAVVLVLSAQTRQVLAHGARGYRHALLEAGLMGERWLLGAVAHGLAACPVGAFYDDEAAALIARRDEWVLHFAALGTAAP